MSQTEKAPSEAAAPAAPGKKDKTKRKDKPVDPAIVLERLAKESRWLDGALAGVVVVFAFLLASFAARNSDFWLHLATGRFLAEGKYAFGVDPFAYTTEHSYWVNHSWLFDLLLYGVTTLAGGPSGAGGVLVVVLKAFLMAGLAALLLANRRPGRSRFTSALCVGLSVLVMAPGMTLQPICVSLFLIGLTLYFLVKDAKPEPAADARGLRLVLTSSHRRLYVLPALCALWANLDAWFFLGPLMIALYLVGEKLQQVLAPERSGPDTIDPDEQRTLGIVLGLSLVACLLNPHHFHVFTAFPVELLPAARMQALRFDPRFAPLFVSPFSGGYFTLDTGINASGLAYFPLLLAGVVSFFLTRHHWRVWRLLLWTAFAVLSASSMALVPFFAVVAGPITALNFQDFASSSDVHSLRLLLSARRMALLLGVILLVATWPGWLHEHPEQPIGARRVGWGVEMEPSLKNVTYKLDYWRTQGLLRPEEHGFNFSPDAANYCAWFCPEQKGFFDGRYTLFSGVATPYAEVRQVLGGIGMPPGRGLAGPVADWQQLFRDRGINHVILSGPSWDRTAPVVARLLADPVQWTPLYLDGRSSVFGWNDPKKSAADQFAKLRFDLKPSTFGADTAAVPLQGPGRPPREWAWWERFTTPMPPRSLDSDAMGVDLLYFETIGRQWQQRHEQELGSILLTMAFGAVNPSAGGLAAGSTVIIDDRWAAPHVANWFRSQWDVAPPEAAIAAVQAGRRAVVDNPDDAEAYRMLAKAVNLVWAAQEKQWAGGPGLPSLSPPQLLRLLEKNELREYHMSPWVGVRTVRLRDLFRQVQLVTLLHQVLVRQPDAYQVHDNLFHVYWNMNYYDVALEHLRASVSILQKTGTKTMRPHDAEKSLKEHEKLVADVEKQVTAVQRYFELMAANQPSKVQAIHAFQPLGLAKQALESLMAEDLAKLNREEAVLLVYLYLTTGRAEELRETLGDKQKAVLGPLYARFRALQAAAVGDYAVADSFLKEAIDEEPAAREAPVLMMLQGLTFSRAHAHLLTQRLLEPFASDQFFAGQQGLSSQQRLRELHALRGLLALESGDVAAAERHLRGATAMTPPYDFESRRIAVRYLDLLKQSR